MHKWEITVESEMGEGSEFIIKVPIKSLEKEYNKCDKETSNLNAFVENIKIEFSNIY
jgi:hypothetical protein